MIEREYSKVFESKLSNIRELFSINDRNFLHEELFKEMYTSSDVIK
jgi:hypothetical protein